MLALWSNLCSFGVICRNMNFSHRTSQLIMTSRIDASGLSKLGYKSVSSEDLGFENLVSVPWQTLSLLPHLIDLSTSGIIPTLTLLYTRTEIQSIPVTKIRVFIYFMSLPRMRLSSRYIHKPHVVLERSPTRLDIGHQIIQHFSESKCDTYTLVDERIGYVRMIWRPKTW